MISDLPRDIAEEVLSRLPMTSLRGVRLTCKSWNTLSKNQSFTKRSIGEAKQKQRKEFQVVMMLEYKVHLMSVNLLNPSIERIGKLVSLDEVVDISNIFHCDGLLLCVTKDRTRLVVWNPFNGQTRWIQPRDTYHIHDRYALGYEKKTEYSPRNHKVLRFVVDYISVRRVCEFEIFSLDSNAWKVVDVNPDFVIQHFYRGLSLKGNTYWFASEKLPFPYSYAGTLVLLCFDVTTESFGPPLFLPFDGYYGDTVTLSSVREEQLAVLFQKSGAGTFNLKIWISSKVDPNGVSWNKVFLAVDMQPLTGFLFLHHTGSFFVDEKKKVVVVIDRTRATSCPTPRNMAYIIGENGYFKTVDLGGVANGDCWPLLCAYVPSSVRINQAAPPDNQRNIPS
ncbi:F-box/kelch-repeat protein At3g16740-like [Raphanus sativus]|uniref:F-box/kelch-repeat protein At3g16740-like n=1 Tax=Raphanus sativus TaxID=3726 RepID=A0A9W3BWT6_RAPSA|nr:F-box/kelch-repeat protein At3g16740-like [Raphanus sativus]